MQQQKQIWNTKRVIRIKVYRSITNRLSTASWASVWNEPSCEAGGSSAGGSSAGGSSAGGSEGASPARFK